MPQAAAHILIPLLLMSIIRDIYIKRTQKSFPLHYVVIAGIAGAIPDLDIAAFWILNFFEFTLQEVHRTFAHTIFVPLIFIILGLVFHRTNLHLCRIRKHTLRLNMLFYMLAFGSFVHLLLDGIFHGSIIPLYPLSSFIIGLDLF